MDTSKNRERELFREGVTTLYALRAQLITMYCPNNPPLLFQWRCLASTILAFQIDFIRNTTFSRFPLR